MNFRHEVIPEAMKLQGVSFPKLEELSGTPESTLKKLARGETKDPRLSSIYPAFNVLGLSIDRACGLAPERDMSKEAATHNVSMAKAMQERLAMQDDRINSLRDVISEQKAEIAAKAATIEAKDKSISHRDEIIRGKDKWIHILVGVIVVIILADILFANVGWLNFGLIG